MPEPEQTLPLAIRLWFAWICFFRVLFDGAFARRAFEARDGKALPEAKPVEQGETPKTTVNSPPADLAVPKVVVDPALQILALFQREGRLVDFLEQELGSFSDVEIGAVARTVHEGCRRALHEHAKIVAVRSEEEGTRVMLEAGFTPSEVKLSGDVQGSAPYRGVLRHKGWRVTELTLPTPVKGHDATVVAPAEVEL